ncbi:hypothetical protein ACOMHN_033307 [Nucella lapillus]
MEPPSQPRIPKLQDSGGTHESPRTTLTPRGKVTQKDTIPTLKDKLKELTSTLTPRAMTQKEPTLTPRGKVTRENNKTEVKTLNMGRKTATLYLSRTYTSMRGHNSSVASQLAPLDTGMNSRQPSQLPEEDELLAVLNKVKREFTFTGYDIMEDNAPKDDCTPEGLDQHERQKRSYVKTYLDSCKMLGVNPVQPIVDSLADTHLVLKTRGLGVKGAKAIAIALVGNKSVESLDLEDNWIGTEGAISIADMLKTNHVLTEVNNYKLKELKVRHNKFGELGGLYMGPAIASNDTLEVLDLAWNHLRGKGAMAVAAGMQVGLGNAGECQGVPGSIGECHGVLEVLRSTGECRGVSGSTGKCRGVLGSVREYWGCRGVLGSAGECRGVLGSIGECQGVLGVPQSSGDYWGVPGSVGECWGVNTGLKILDISWNGFASDSCKILGQSLKTNFTLRELDISSNRLDAEAIGGLLKGVQANETLSTLKVGNNPLTPDVATIILKAIAKAERSDISELDMSNIVVEEEFQTLLDETKKTRLLFCKTGPVIKKGQTLVKEGDKISSFMDPVQALYEYMSEKAYRVIDLFKRFDADRSLSVTREEFAKGLISASVPMNVGQLEDLIEMLDKNKDGVVDLKDLIDGEKLFRRKRMRKKLRKQSIEMSSRRRSSDGDQPAGHPERSQEEKQSIRSCAPKRTRRRQPSSSVCQGIM